MWTRNGQKYNATRASFQGKVYDSALERNDAIWLATLVKDGKITDLKEQVRYRIFIGEKHICDSIVDFQYRIGDRLIWHETKGFPTDVWKLKKKMIEATLPEGEEYLVNPGERQLFGRL